MSSLTSSPAWIALREHQKAMSAQHMRMMFQADPDRFRKFSLSAGPLFLDYSKNRITEKTIALLFDLARQCQVSEWTNRMFKGEKINFTEHRAVLHTALRDPSTEPLLVDGMDVHEKVRQVLSQMRNFTESVCSGRWKGYTGETITDVVNIGIGGSDLGPAMAVQALVEDCTGPRAHFVSNVDGAHLVRTLRHLNPARTLFVVASKTFTTQETLMNARSAREWFLSQARHEKFIPLHFVALSTNRKEVSAFGISPDHMFEFWDWVGGRYSLWSSIGLSLALTLGMDKFSEMLLGAFEIDEHFRTAPLEKNMPVILAMLGVWYINFFNAQTQAILPYDQGMSDFVSYLQQMTMESNGKSVTREGIPVDYATGAILWGGVGTNGQHAYFQLLHQGTPLIPADFIAPVHSRTPLGNHHQVLLSNFLAQTEALMRGKSRSEAQAELLASGMNEATIQALLPHKCFEGNRPSNSLLIDQLNPRSLGALVALYEHRTFVQSLIWNINAFDQWGVELGKQLAQGIQTEWHLESTVSSHDASTNGLLEMIRKT